MPRKEAENHRHLVPAKRSDIDELADIVCDWRAGDTVTDRE